MSLIKDTNEYVRRDRVILCNGTVFIVDNLSAISTCVDADGPYVRFYIIGSDPVTKDIDVKDKYKDKLSDEDISILINQLAYDISDFVQSSNRFLTTFDIQGKFNKLMEELIDSRKRFDTSMYD